MSASITPFGTSRSVYSFANSDIEINGNVNANQFIGDGQNITNINIDNINNANVNFNKKLIKNIGGTGNSTYIDKGIVFNNNSTDKFDTTSNLYWDYNENILYINKKNIVETFSSYTDKSSNSIIETIKNTSNNIIKEIKNTIQSNIFIENVQGIPKGSKTNYGIYKVGEGIFVNNGVLSIAPAPIVIKEPSVEPKLIPSIIEDTTYEKFIFKYDPNRGTTFEVNDNSILQYHFNFNEITDVNNIKSIGIQKNNIIINNITNVFLEPTINKKYEYTPLDNNYLYFDGVNSFAQFDSNFNMYNIYSDNLIEGGPEIGITFSFWFKTHSFIHVDKFLFSFSNSNINTYRFEIKIIKSGEFNHLAVNIRQGTDNEWVISDVKIYINTWYHFVWTIDKHSTWGLYVNYQNNPNQIYEKLLFNMKGISINSDYSIKYIGKAAHRSNTNLRFSISDIRIYNKVLNKTDITELYKLDEYTQYKISFNDPNYTNCDILLIGGGGGGTNEGGGGAGELIFINNAIFEEKEYVIKVGRGGAGRVTEIIDGNNTILQKNTKGINTVFGNIIVNGGGSASVLSGKGGSGSGNGGTLKLNTNVNDFNYRKIYFRGNDGYQINGGGGGSGSIGKIYDGGDGIGTIEDIINNTTYNFGELFDLLNDADIGYYDANSDLIFFAGGGGSNINNSYGGLGGGGDGSSDYIENINYKGQKNTGSGGGGYNDHGYSGGSGIVILRYLQTEIISSGIGNQLIITSNNLLSKINELTTDNIIQQNNNNKKFIIDNVYDNDLLLNGSLTINSNLIIHGETTIFNTDIYISEKVNISNYDSDTALHVKQFGNIVPDFNNIFIIDYNESRLFTISDNGNVGVGVLPQSHNLLDVKGNINIVSQINKDFKFTINNRDIIRDTSNYTSRTSNILISDYNTKFRYASNYILETSNFHRIDYDTKFKYASNYILENSNFHRIDYDTKFHDASNYILENSNFHRIDYDTKFHNASNYILETSNVISSRITNLNADSIADGIINKFIINNKYENDLEIIGDLKASNLIIYGEKTYLYTDIYTTEQLNVENNGLGTAFNVKQLNSSYSIFNASNSETEVFTILNEGNVGIGGIIPSGNNLLEVRGNVNIISHLNEKFKFTINNRDIIRETSNYILETSNFHRIDYDTKFHDASNYILETSNFHRIDYDTKFHDASNYILETSNFHRIDYDTKFHDASNYILETSNFHRIDYDTKFHDASNYILETSNFHRIDYDTKFHDASNYILETSNFHRIDYDTKFHDASNYILETSNFHRIDYDTKFHDASNYILETSNFHRIDYDTKFHDASNYILETSNFHRIDYDTKFHDASNYILETSNFHRIDYDTKFHDASNYILETSNFHRIDYDTKFHDASNYILETSNFHRIDYDTKFHDASNYILETSNFHRIDYDTKFHDASNYILETSNFHRIDYDTKFHDASNYILETSNFHRIDYDTKFHDASNYILETSNFHRIDYDTKFHDASNYILETSNFHRIDYDTKFHDASNYILETSNFHRIDYDTKFHDASNYILETSNFHRIDYDTKFHDASNYILETSNFHRIDYDTKFHDASNYILETSNFHRIDYDTKFHDASNYILETSNFHRIDYDTKFHDASNYILETSNFHRIDYDTKFHDASNYILETSNFHRIDYDTKFHDASNYILETSNIISNRITNANIDSIANGIINKFIINNKYENDLEIIGDLKASNLIIYGEKSYLYTDIYTTEQLSIENKGLGTALSVKQSNTSYNIFNASNNITEVFTILNNGNIGIGTTNPSSILEIIGDIKIYGNILPILSNTCNLGSPINRWKDLYLSGTSIFLDDIIISKKSDEGLAITDTQGNYKNLNINTIELDNGSKKLYISLDSLGNIKYTKDNSEILYPSLSTNINDSKNTITSNTVKEYIEVASNILRIDYDTKFHYASNYIFETSNFHRIDYDTKFHDASNYILETSNFHRIDYDTKFHDASNYILETSNFHRIDYDTKFHDASNYILETSNFHRIDYDTKFHDASNYILETSNFHRIDYDTKFHYASNYILETSNFHRIDYDTKFHYASNYILETSNVISSRITNLNADSIADGIINKFIINNKYENDLEIIGDLKASNLIIYGEKTYLYTDIYTTEQLNVENNGLGTAFNVKQLNSSYSIFNASNSETEVFTILNEGNVGIGGIIPSGDNLLEVKGNINIVSHLNEDFKFTINNRDIIRETSNYILETSNFHRIDYDTKFHDASNYILETSNFHRIDYDTKFHDASNYILETSNFHRIDYDTKFHDASNYILETSNFHRIDYDTKFHDASNYILETSNFHRIDYDTKFHDASNYILETSNFHRIDYDTKFHDASNYILETSNFHRIDYDTKFHDASNYILETSNFHRIDYDTKFHDASNYILETSNFHRIDYDTKFHDASNYILETSNFHRIDYDTKFHDASNYILETSNFHRIDYDTKFHDASNYILETSNFHRIDYDTKFHDASNYILETSNFHRIDYDTKFHDASNYILETSNFHRIDYDTKFHDASNYILETSNFHRIDYDTKFHDASNYILETSNFHRIDYDTKFQDASNYILENSNFHRIDYDTKFHDASNYILGTSNIISTRITNLNADSIADGNINKFIINNKYENNLEIVGDLTASNLTIYGENTILYTDVYTTEQLDVINKGLGTALNVKQFNSSYSIFNASNSTSEVFTILNEGNVGIGGIIPSGDNLLEVRGNVNIVSRLNEDFKFTINNRDIIKETSNYILENSNFHRIDYDTKFQDASNYILETSNFHRIDYDTKFQYASNYILETSNLISSIITYLTTDNIADGNTNKFIVSGKYDGNIEIKGDLITSNITIIGEKTSLVNNIFKTEVLELSNNGIDTAIKVIQLNPTYDIFNAYNNTENVFTILGNGNIGIGEKNPLVKLEINGDVNIYSNLYVNGTETIINTKLKAKNILIENNTLEKALTIKQSIGNDILSVSNINREVLTIKNDGRIGINNAYPENTLDVYGNINATSYTRDGYPLSLEFSQGMIIQTKHLTYSKTEIKNGNDWEPINNDINNGFVIAIKPSDITSKILISTVCHIGMEYETDSRWWGIRLYRKIGNGTWTHISNANGIIDNNENGTSCWISHNLGADSSTYSHFITNITGSYQDTPNTIEIVYYTAYWKNRVGELSDGLLYLNKSSYTLDNNYPRPSSSWTATEIWNKGVSYIAPLQSTQIQINTQYNSVGIDTSPPTEVHKLKVNGSINIIDGTYNMNGYDIMQNISNFILNTSNILIQKINELLNRIELLENN